MRRIATGVTTMTMALGMVATIGVGSASAAVAIQASPSSGLTNNQVVTVTGSGFTPNEPLYVIECLATATDQTGCDTSTVSLTQTSAQGTISLKFPVATGQIANGKTCGTAASDLTACVINVATAQGTDTAATPITFALPVVTTTTVPVKTYHPRLMVVPSTGLRKGRVVTVSGSGFKPGDHVYIVECLASGSTAAQCNLATTMPKTITARGLLPVTKFKVVTGKVGTGRCGTKPSNLRSCAIDVGNAAKKDAASVRLTFVL
jgi:hypothetical protein